MTLNGKQFSVRSFVVVLLAVGLLSSFGNAETVHGTFKLPVQARWGSMLLKPGDYEFKADNGAGGSIVTVRSMNSQQSGMVMSIASSNMRTVGSGLKLGESEGMRYIKALYVGDLDLELNFAIPKSRIAKVAKSSQTTVASASGSH